MACNYNIKVVEGNEFALLLPLKKRTYVASVPIDEDIVYADLQDCEVKIGGVEYAHTIEENGVQVIIPATLAKGTYDIVLTAEYRGSDIRAAYFDGLTIVAYNQQSDAQQYIAGSPIVAEAAFVIGGTLTDAELEALKAEYREKIAAAEEAEAAAQAAKEEYDQKAEMLDGVAQEQTLTQGVQTLSDKIDNIDIDTTTLAKQGTNAGATLTATQTAATNAYASAEAAKTGVVDGNDTAVSVGKDIRSEVGTGSDTAAETGTLFAVVKWMKDKVKDIYSLIGYTISALRTLQESYDYLADHILPDQQLIQECYDIAEEKHATMPQHKTLANLPDTLQTINATEQGDIVLSALTIANVPECEYTNLYKVYFANSFPKGDSNSYLRAVYNIRGYSSGWTNAFASSLIVEEITFSNFTINGGTDYLRAANIKRFDMTGLHIGENASGSFGQVFYPTLTTLIGNHTLDEVLDGLAVLHNNHLAIDLTLEVLLRREDFRAVINGLKDLTGGTAKTLTLGATNLAKLTAEDIAVATAKGWVIQ